MHDPLLEAERKKNFKVLQSRFKENGIFDYKFPSKHHEDLALLAFQGMSRGDLEPFAVAIESGCYGMDFLTAQTIISLIRGGDKTGDYLEYKIPPLKHAQGNYKKRGKYLTAEFRKKIHIIELLKAAGIENGGTYDSAIKTVASEKGKSDGNPYGINVSGVRKIWAAYRAQERRYNAQLEELKTKVSNTSTAE